MKKLSLLFMTITVLLISVVLSRELLAQGMTIVFITSKDNTLYESANGSLSNGAGEYLFTGTTNTGDIRRGLLAFDVSDIPQGSIIQSVSLTLNMSKSVAGQEVLSLHRLLAAWGEGASNASLNEGTGANAQSGDATWLHRFWGTDNTWETPGGDFSPTASATQTVEGVGKYTWESTGQLIADVKSWVDNPNENFGWILIGNESASKTAKRFDSRENAKEGNRPVLSVVYLTPTAVEENNVNKPGTFTLAQNTPNPFNPMTTIAYTIPDGSYGRVTLNVYDVRGVLVKTLVDRVVGPGIHAVVWDGSDNRGNSVSSGMYIYRLQSGMFIASNKMILTR